MTWRWLYIERATGILGYMTQPAWPEREWVTAAELAAITRVHPRTVLREIRRSNLVARKHGGWIIDRPEAERWAAQFAKYAGLRKEDTAEP
jgi:hypothetical protein